MVHNPVNAEKNANMLPVFGSGNSWIENCSVVAGDHALTKETIQLVSSQVNFKENLMFALRTGLRFRANPHSA